MMGRSLNAATLFDDLDVTLWGGHDYTLKTITKTVSASIDVAQKAASELDEDSTADEQVGALITIIDVLLEPKAKTPPAKEVLQGLWDTDEIGMDQLQGFVQSLTEEARLRRRPTPESTSKTRT